MLAAAVVEGYGLTNFGYRKPGLDALVHLEPSEVFRYETLRVVFNILAILFGGLLVRSAAIGSNFRASFSQCATLVGYGFAPIFFMWFFDAIPGLNTWVCWGVGMALSLSVLYHGVGLMLKPDQTKGFGLYLITVLVVLFLSAIAQLYSAYLLDGRSSLGLV